LLFVAEEYEEIRCVMEREGKEDHHVDAGV
jgi:hypothetical protein